MTKIAVVLTRYASFVAVLACLVKLAVAEDGAPSSQNSGEAGFEARAIDPGVSEKTDTIAALRAKIQNVEESVAVMESNLYRQYPDLRAYEQYREKPHE
jgi:hypothetical protein